MLHIVEQAVQVLVSAVGRTEADPSCRSCSVARDATDELEIHYSEEWVSEEAFRRHLQSEMFRRVLMAMDMSCEDPHVTVGNLSGRRGIFYLQEEALAEPLASPACGGRHEGFCK
jgi:quinol monooxygenase YgiN